MQILEAPPGVRLFLDSTEASILRGLVGEMRSVITSGMGNVTNRLFPQAFEDPVNEADYRDLVGGELRRVKMDGLSEMATKLGSAGHAELELDADECATWLAVVTDMRLAIGTKLEVTEEVMSAEPDPRDPGAAGLNLMHWLGWLSERMIAALT